MAALNTPQKGGGGGWRAILEEGPTLSPKREREREGKEGGLVQLAGFWEGEGKKKKPPRGPEKRVNPQGRSSIGVQAASLVRKGGEGGDACGLT